LGYFFKGLAPPSEQANRHTPRAQRPRDGGTDAAAGAGYHGHLARQVFPGSGVER
jgi:hypothetical protein